MNYMPLKSLIRKTEESTSSHVNCEDLPEWKGNCCLASPVCASQIIVVWDWKEKYIRRLKGAHHRYINETPNYVKAIGNVRVNLTLNICFIPNGTRRVYSHLVGVGMAITSCIFPWWISIKLLQTIMSCLQNTRNYTTLLKKLNCDNVFNVILVFSFFS